MAPRRFWYKKLPGLITKKNLYPKESIKNAELSVFIFPDNSGINCIRNNGISKYLPFYSLDLTYGSILVNNSQIIYLLIKEEKYKVMEFSPSYFKTINLLSKKYSFFFELGDILKIYKLIREH